MKAKSIILILSTSTTQLSCSPPQQTYRSYNYSSEYVSVDSTYSQNSDTVTGRSATVRDNTRLTPTHTNSRSTNNDNLSTELHLNLSKRKSRSNYNDDSSKQTLTDPPIRRRPGDGSTYRGVGEGVGVGLLWGATIVIGGIGAGKLLSSAELAAIIHTQLPAVDPDEYEIASIIHGYAREFQELGEGGHSTSLTGIESKGHFINNRIFNINKWCDVENALSDLDEDVRENTAGMFSKPAHEQILKLKNHARRSMLTEYSKLLSHIGKKHPGLPEVIQPCFDGATIPLDVFIVCFDWIQDNTTDYTAWTSLAKFLDNPPPVFKQALKEIFP